MSRSDRDIFRTILEFTISAKSRIDLVASENYLSPLAVRGYGLEVSNRYNLDDQRIFGYDAFPSGKVIRDFEDEFVCEPLSRLLGFDLILPKPLSGISAMTIAIAASSICNGNLYSIDLRHGGHPSTASIAKNLGLRAMILPYQHDQGLIIEDIEREFRRRPPSIIYIDQSNVLKPLDSRLLKRVVDEIGPEVRPVIIYDVSHLLGLLLGGAVSIEILKGCDIVAGSTHKSFPGPAKGFIGTSSEDLFGRIINSSDHWISHTNPGSTFALGLALYEFERFGGGTFACETVRNCELFARATGSWGLEAYSMGAAYSETHQLWYDVGEVGDPRNISSLLFQAGIVVNCLPALPPYPFHSLRLGFAEMTRRGAPAEAFVDLAEVFTKVCRGVMSPVQARSHVQRIRATFDTERFNAPIDVHQEMSFR